MGGQDSYDDQDSFDENPRFTALDDHLQFQVLDSQEGTKKMGSEVEGLDQDKKGMESQPLPLSFVYFVVAHDLFDENPRFVALDDHLQFQVLDSQEGTKKMGSDVDGLDQEKGMDCQPLPQCFVDYVDAQDLFDENPRFAALDDHSQFQVMDSQEGTKKIGSEVDGLDQEKGMDYLPLPLSFVDFLDDHYPFDENLSHAAPNDQEDVAEKMAY